MGCGRVGSERDGMGEAGVRSSVDGGTREAGARYASILDAGTGRSFDDLIASGSASGVVTLVRADLNVPLERDRDNAEVVLGVADASRIEAAMCTVEKLSDAGARVVLVSHLGRPGGVQVPGLGMGPVAEVVGRLLAAGGRGARWKGLVTGPGGCVGKEREAGVGSLRDGEVLMLENLRFHAGEEADDAGFAADLARGCGLYVNDAFGCSHRSHASVTLKGVNWVRRVPGVLLTREVETMRPILAEPRRPMLTVVGGSKVKDKLGVLRAVLKVADTLCVGGRMAFAFLAAQGVHIGDDKVGDRGHVDLARDVLEEAGRRGVRVVLPVDVVCGVPEDAARGLVTGNVRQVCAGGGCGVGHANLADPCVVTGDVGPQTLALYAEAVAEAQTVLWNGPVGIFEVDAFSEGTARVGELIAQATERGAVTVVGGGDTGLALAQAGSKGRVGFVSTGGGATLEFITLFGQGKVLPGIASLAFERCTQA